MNLASEPTATSLAAGARSDSISGLKRRRRKNSGLILDIQQIYDPQLPASGIPKLSVFAGRIENTDSTWRFFF